MSSHDVVIATKEAIMVDIKDYGDYKTRGVRDVGTSPF